jgi:hypothetical protein
MTTPAIDRQGQRLQNPIPLSIPKLSKLALARDVLHAGFSGCPTVGYWERRRPAGMYEE